MSTTLTTDQTTEQLDDLLSQAIGFVAQARIMADLHDPDRTTVEHDRALMVQAGLISLQNSLGDSDGRPAPKLAATHAARVETAMAGAVL